MGIFTSIFKIADKDKVDLLVTDLVEKKYEFLGSKILKDSEYEVKGYFAFDDQGKDISWGTLVSSLFDKDFGKIYVSPKSVFIVNRKTSNDYFAFTFGYSSKTVSLFSERSYPMDLAKKMPLKLKEESLFTPNSVRPHSAYSYTKFDGIDFDSNGTFLRIMGTVKDSELLKNCTGILEFSESIKLTVIGDDISNFLNLIEYFKKAEKLEDVREIPLLSEIKNKEEIARLNNEMFENFDESRLTVIMPDFSLVAGSELYLDSGDFTAYLKGKSNKNRIFSGGKLNLLEEKGIEYLYINNAVPFTYENVKKTNIVFNNDTYDEVSLYELLQYGIDDKCSVLLNGKWYEYNNEYLNRVRNEIDSIELVKESRFDLGRKQLNQIDAGNLNYREFKFNKYVAESKDFSLKDRKSASKDKYRFEPMDLLEEKTNIPYAVKFGRSSSKLSYLIDQSRTSMDYLQEKGFKDIGIWIVIDSGGRIDKLSKLRMLSFHNDLVDWIRVARRKGLTPHIRLNFYSDN